MNIRVVNYTPSGSPLVQAFVDVEIDNWIRFNGLNFHRDGTLRSAQLTPSRQGNPGNHRVYRDAVKILDEDLAKVIAAEIVAAIQAHIVLLPEEGRLRPPVPSKRPSKPSQSPAAQGNNAAPVKATVAAPLAPAAARVTVQPDGGRPPGPTKLKPLPPPQRLMLPRSARASIRK
jgi:hypothetical protein